MEEKRVGDTHTVKPTDKGQKMSCARDNCGCKQYVQNYNKFELYPCKECGDVLHEYKELSEEDITSMEDKAATTVHPNEPTKKLDKGKTSAELCKNDDIETENEIEDYVHWVKNPKFFDMINTELGRTIVNEEIARQTILIYVGMAFVDNVKPTSNNLLVSCGTGAGKDHVVSETLKILPRGIVRKPGRISSKTLSYWNIDWTGKALYLKDPTSELMNDQTIKLFVEGEADSVIVQDYEVVETKIEGKPTVFITSANNGLHQEMLRRLPILRLDDSEAQTRAVKLRILKHGVEGTSEEFDSNVTKSIGCLKRIKVKIPFCEKLDPHISDKHTITRTITTRILDLIKGVTWYYQYQREKDPQGFIIATEQDYEYARKVYNASLQNEFNIPLDDNLVRVLKPLLLNTCSLDLIQLMNETQCFSRQRLMRLLQRLASMGLIKMSSVVGDFGRAKNSYEAIRNEKKELPAYNKL